MKLFCYTIITTRFIVIILLEEPISASVYFSGKVLRRLAVTGGTEVYFKNYKNAFIIILQSFSKRFLVKQKMTVIYYFWGNFFFFLRSLNDFSYWILRALIFFLILLLLLLFLILILLTISSQIIWKVFFGGVVFCFDLFKMSEAYLEPS